jgi:hypothetical protein
MIRHGIYSLAGAALLSACGPADIANGGSAPMTALAAEMVAEELVKPRLRDPDSAVFTDITFKQGTASKGPIICGHVNSRNGFGGMTGPQRFITGGTVIVEEDVGHSNMDTAWARFC